MSREIKFRAWDKEKEVMVRVDYIDWVGGIAGVYNEDSGSYEVILEYIILLQYTGLKDKNGVEIYEGNVMRDSDNIVGVIEIEDGNTYWNWEDISTLLSENHDTLENIGNIYENPELIQ